MKTPKTLIIWLTCLLSVCFAGSLEAQSTGPFTITKYEKIIPAYKNQPNSEEKMEITLSLADSKQAKLSKLLSTLLYKGQTSKKYSDEVIKKYESQYLEEAEEMPPWALQQEYGEYHRVTVNGSYAVITRTISAYFGGAHPNTVITYFVIDTKTPALLSINDLITQAGFPGLKSIAERKLIAYGEEIEENINTSNLKMDNYYPDTQGLVFFWDPYELSSYAVGQIDIIITWNEAEAFLTTAGKKLSAVYRK